MSVFPSAILLTFTLVCLVALHTEAADTNNPDSTNTVGSNVQPGPAYPGPKAADPVAGYANAAAAYPGAPAVAYGGYEAGYGMQNPSMYDYMIASSYPNIKNEVEETQPEPVTTLGFWLPAFKTVFALIVKMVTKLGFLVLGGAGLLMIGVVFTTAVCSMTPLCTISFLDGYGVSQDTVRALLTPDKITATAQFVQQAIDKYQKLQSVVN